MHKLASLSKMITRKRIYSWGLVTLFHFISDLLETHPGSRVLGQNVHWSWTWRTNAVTTVRRHRSHMVRWIPTQR